MDTPWDFAAIEKKWQELWAKRDLPLPAVSVSRERSRSLMSMPIAPGKVLSLGDIRALVWTDALARFWRQQGYTVFHPLILNAFDSSVRLGAQSLKMTPSKFLDSQKTLLSQTLRRLGCRFHPHHLQSTSDPAWIQKTQNLVLAMAERGLVYRHNPSGTCPEWYFRRNLSDWMVSRQDSWGTPIPYLFGAHQGWIPVHERNLPVGLGHPYPNQIQSMHGREPASSPEESLDSTVDMAWSAACVCSGPEISRTNIDHWLPVDCLIADKKNLAEHLEQARFMQQVLCDLGLSKVEEPYRKVLIPGEVHGSENMDAWGADVLRVTLLTTAPLSSDLFLKDDRFLQSQRDLGLLWSLAKTSRQEVQESEVFGPLNHAFEQAFETGDFSMAWSLWRQTLHEKQVSIPTLKLLIRLIHPIAPHLTSALWQNLTGSDHIEEITWLPNR